LAVGVLLTVVMTTWQRGRALLADPAFTHAEHVPLRRFIDDVAAVHGRRDDETAVVMTGTEDMVPNALVRAVERTRVAPGRLVLLTVKTMPVPTVRDEDAVEVRPCGCDCWGVTARHGYMERPDVNRFLALCTARGLALDPHDVWFYLS